ncbi:MAG TPA: hypothetical protein PLH57_12140 [Oligoflexia bacterium]|nr:hypothetical protein [Oligoflexia bacterium]
MSRPLKIGEWKDKSVEAVSDAVDKVVLVSKNAATTVDKKAHKRPWLFMGVAALFSSFFGFFLGRKTKK